VHEQFMTETAQAADIVLPATMFLEHDDVYQSGGHQHITLGPKVIESPEGCRSNHEVIVALAKRLGAEHPGFSLTPRELIDKTLQASGWGSFASLASTHWIDCQPAFREAHYLDGFGHADKRFRFSADWHALQPHGFAPDSLSDMPTYPDHWEVIETATDDMPYRMVTAPARHYLNSSFTEVPTSIRREREPTVMMHPDDARALRVDEGDYVRLGNERGNVLIKVEVIIGVTKGVVVVESIWPNHAFKEGIGINALTSAEPVAPVGGAAFHDTRVWVKTAEITG
ncbi:MAG: molybdopterin dinucleotide binding domain-containing protein, partial [Pseudomonadota bacterium]